MNKLEKIKDFINSSEKIILLYHIDADGVCSAKIVHESLKKMNKEIMDYFPSSPKMIKSRGFQKGISKDDPELIICVDVPLIENEKIFENNKKKKFIVIDHHGISSDPNSENIVYINPKLDDDETYIPASKLCYDTFKKVCNVNFDWVSAAGVIGDTGGLIHKDFVEKILKKYEYKKAEDDKYYFKTVLGEIAKIINSAKVFKGSDGAQKALRVIEECRTPEEFMNKSYELRMWKEKIDNYLNYILDDFEANKEEYPKINLAFYTFKPEYMIGSTLSTLLSFRHPHTNIIILSIKNGKTTVNFRRHDKKVSMNKLARESVRGLRNAGGGGHVPAAGAHLQTRDVNLFKRNVVRVLKKIM